MPVITPEYLDAVCAMLRERRLPNSNADALRWTQRLLRPLYMGCGVV